jgi:hypothetical protein
MMVSMTLEVLVFVSGVIMGMTTMNLLWMWRCGEDGN